MYHSISYAKIDPWNICVSPKHFEEQVQFLKKNFNIISLDELINQLQKGKISSNSVCLTFDDGYANNYTNAKSILEKYNCPATFFISTAFINQAALFWWDELEFVLLHHNKLPYELSLEIESKIYTYTLECKLTEQQWLKHKQWKWYEEPSTKRCEVFLNIWEKLRPQPLAEIKKQTAAIKKWAEIINYGCTDYLPLRAEQLLDLSKNNLFKIGLHTYTHADLQGKEKRLQRKEIVCCKEVLKNKFTIESNYLAYPYGRYDNATIEACKQLQLAACFTTEATGVDISSDTTKLGRYQVCNWNISYFKEQLIAWNK